VAFRCRGEPTTYTLCLCPTKDGRIAYLSVVCDECGRSALIDLRPQGLSTLVHADVSGAKETVEAVRKTIPKSNRGRPKTTGSPWKALGLSKATYYRRQKAGK
jgi:hypothetical protein